MRVYESYPFKESDGTPSWRYISAQEQSNFLQVKWPTLIQLLFPSLKDKIIVSGDEANANKATAPGQTFLERMREAITKNFKSFMWRYGSKDYTRVNEAILNRGQAYQVANKAWDQIKYHQPRPSYAPALYELLDSRLVEESNRQKAKGQTNPTLWLRESEAYDLTRAIGEQNLDEAIETLHSPVRMNSSRELQVETQEIFRAYKEEICLYDRFENVENPALLDKIKDTLRKSPLGASLLDLAEKDGICLHLQRHKSGAIRDEQTPGAYISGKEIYLIDAEEDNIGTQAVYLGHELRHHWQAVTLAEFYQANSTPIDRILRTDYKELDAWTVTALLAHNLHQQGVKLSDGLTNSAHKFAHICQDIEKNHHLTSGQAKKIAMAYFFHDFITSHDLLKVYEVKHAKDFMQINVQDLQSLIAESPYNKEDFIMCATAIGPESYLEPAMIPAIVKSLQERVGKSPSAQQALNWAQPQHRLEATVPPNGGTTMRPNPALALVS
jgi:hypothetical protein